MASFNLTAELNLRGPSNLNQVVSNIRRQLSTVSLNLNINPATSRGIQAVTADVRTLSTALRDAQANAVALSTTLRGLGAATSNVARATSSLGSNLGSISGQASGTATAIKAASSEMTEFGRQSALAVRRFAAFSVATGAIYALSRAITSAYGEFVNFNKEFVKLQQVTDSTASGLTSLSSEITRLSTSLGVSSQELLQVSVTLAQAGLSAGETKTALEALAKSALAPSFDSLNDTVEGSIALMRQFGISAADLESSLGSVNAVAAKFAVEASDIIAAIQRTGGVFANASKGVSEGKDALNEFLAVFTSVRATTRESAETIATGLRTIFTRIQRTGTIDALKQYGISLTDLEGKFVGPYEAVKRLSEGLKALDPRDLRFSSIVEELGGFRQIGKVIPLIQQFETAQKALGVAQRGAGSLAVDAATAQEALSIRINKVREQFVALIRDIGQSQGFQTFVDISLKLASALISVADAAKDVLPAIAAITAIRGVGSLGQFFGGFTGGLGRNKPRGFAKGGFVPGQGNRDTVPAMLTPGEFVIRKKAVEKIGAGNLGRINKYADGGIVQKFAKGGKIEDKIKKNMIGKTYQFGLVGLRSGTGSPIKTSERLEPDVSVGKEPNIKQYPVTLFRSTLSSITQKEQEKTIERDISTAFGQMVEKTASTLRGVLGGSKASGNKKQQILKGSPLTSVIGTVFESALGFLGGPYIDKSEKTKSIDFPLGLGKAAKNFGIPPNIPTDATRTIGGSGKGISQMRGQIARFITAVEGEEFTKSFEKFKQNKLLERSKATASSAMSGYRAKVFDALKNTSIKTVLSSNDIRILASELGVGVNKLNKQAMSGTGKASLSGVLVSAGKDPEEAYKTIYERLRMVQRRAQGGGISGQDTVPALLTPGEFVINKKAAQKIGGAKLNKLNNADKISGFNKGGAVGHIQRFAVGGSALPARPTASTPFNLVVPPNTIQALQEIAKALENMGVSASESARLLERGGAVSVNASERAYQADLNRLRIAGASASDIYDMEQRLAQVREQNATKIRTSQEFSGLTGAQLQDIQSGAELGRERIIANRRSVMQSRGRSADEIQAALADSDFQDYARRTAFERSTSAVTGRSARDLQRAGIGGQDIEAYVNQSMMDTSTLRQMDQQLLETRRQQLRNETSYSSALDSQKRRMMRELNARTNEEIAERRNIVNQLRKDRGLSGGFLGREGAGLNRILGAGQTGMALLGMGQLREDAFGQGPRGRRFATGFNRVSAGMQSAGMGLTFAGGMIGDTIGKAMGGKEGQALSSAVSAFVGSAGIGMMFGPIGALTGVVVGATTAIQAWKDSIIDATLQEEAEKIETATQKLQGSFEKLSKAKDPQEAQAALKSAASEFQKISTSESKRQANIADKILPEEPGFFGSIWRSLTGARGQGASWDPTGYSGMLLNPADLKMAQAEKEIVSSARQTNVLQSLPQQFELGIQKGLSLQQIQASFPPGELDRLKELFAVASGDTALAGLVAKRESMEKQRREGVQGIDTTAIDAAIKNLANRFFNQDFLKGLQDRINSEKAIAAASAAATLEIDLLNQVLTKIGSAASKAGAQFEEAQRQIAMQQSVMFGGGQIQGPDRSQENVLDNVLSYSFEEIRNVIGRIGSEYQFNPAITREAQDAAVSQKILQQELPRILAEVNAVEGEGFNPEGASADVIRKKLEEVFSKFMPNAKQRNETIERVIKNLTKRLKSRQRTTVEDLAEDESVLAEILKNVGAPVEAFNSLLKQSNDILAAVNAGMNEWVSNLSTATDMRIDAQNISIEAGNQLSKVLGEELSLGDMNQAFENTISTLTQRIGAGGAGVPGTGTLDPGTIMQRMLEREKDARDIQSQLDKEKPPVGSARFNELSESLKRAKLEASNLSRAHQKLQNDSSRASNALTKIGELRQVQDAKQSSLLDLLKNVNDPEAMMQFTNEVQSFFAQMAGQGSRENLPAAIAGLERQMAVLPAEQAQAIRDDFIKSLETIRGLDPNALATLKALIPNVTGVEASPEMKGLIAEFYKYTDVQKEAITQASNALVDGAKTAGNSLIAAGIEVQRTISAAGQDNPRAVVPMQPQNQSKGGMIYASKGQYVNYQPKGTDTVPAMLTPGEFVVNAKATKKHRGLLQAINSNSKAGGYSKGGMVYLAGGGYVPVDTTIDSDYQDLMAQIQAFERETQSLLEPVKLERDRVQGKIAALSEGLAGTQNEQEKAQLQTAIDGLSAQWQSLDQQLTTIETNRKATQETDFQGLLANINARREAENMRRIAQTGELTDSDKAKLAAGDSGDVAGFEERQKQRETNLLQQANKFAEGDARQAQAKKNAEEQEKQQQIQSMGMPAYQMEQSRKERQAAVQAEKERRRQEFLSRNPFYRKKAEEKLSKEQQEKEEARQWYLKSNTLPDGSWNQEAGVDPITGARMIPDDVLQQYRKNKAQEKAQANRERLLYGSAVSAGDPEAEQKKARAAELEKEDIAELNKIRRGEELARRFQWTLPDTKPSGNVVGSYGGYERGEEPFELRQLSAEDRQALDDFQMRKLADKEKEAREKAKQEALASTENQIQELKRKREETLAEQGKTIDQYRQEELNEAIEAGIVTRDQLGITTKDSGTPGFPILDYSTARNLTADEMAKLRKARLDKQFADIDARSQAERETLQTRSQELKAQRESIESKQRLDYAAGFETNPYTGKRYSSYDQKKLAEQRAREEGKTLDQVAQERTDRIARTTAMANKAKADRLSREAYEREQAEYEERMKVAAEKAREEARYNKIRFETAEKNKGYLGYFAEGLYETTPTRAVGEAAYGLGEVAVGGLVGGVAGLSSLATVVGAVGARAMQYEGDLLHEGTLKPRTDLEEDQLAQGLLAATESNLRAAGAGFSTAGTGFERIRRAFTFDKDTMEAQKDSALATYETQRAQELSNQPLLQIPLGGDGKTNYSLRLPSQREIFGAANVVRDEALGAAIPMPAIPGAGKAFGNVLGKPVVSRAVGAIDDKLLKPTGRALNQKGLAARTAEAATTAGQRVSSGAKSFGQKLSELDKSMSIENAARITDYRSGTIRVKNPTTGKVERIPEIFADNPAEYFRLQPEAEQRILGRNFEYNNQLIREKTDAVVQKARDAEAANIFEELDVIESFSPEGLSPMQQSIVASNAPSVAPRPTISTKPTPAPTAATPTTRGGMDPRFGGRSLMEEAKNAPDIVYKDLPVGSAAAADAAERKATRKAAAEAKKAAGQSRQTLEEGSKSVQKEAEKAAAEAARLEAKAEKKTAWYKYSGVYKDTAKTKRASMAEEARAKAQAAQAQAESMKLQAENIGSSPTPKVPPSVSGTPKKSGKATIDPMEGRKTTDQLRAEASAAAERKAMEGPGDDLQRTLGATTPAIDAVPTPAAAASGARSTRAVTPRPPVSSQQLTDPVAAEAERILKLEQERFLPGLDEARKRKLALQIAESRRGMVDRKGRPQFSDIKEAGDFSRKRYVPESQRPLSEKQKAARLQKLEDLKKAFPEGSSPTPRKLSESELTEQITRENKKLKRIADANFIYQEENLPAVLSEPATSVDDIIERFGGVERLSKSQLEQLEQLRGADPSVINAADLSARAWSSYDPKAKAGFWDWGRGNNPSNLADSMAKSRAGAKGMDVSLGEGLVKLEERIKRARQYPETIKALEETKRLKKELSELRSPKPTVEAPKASGTAKVTSEALPNPRPQTTTKTSGSVSSPLGVKERETKLYVPGGRYKNLEDYHSLTQAGKTEGMPTGFKARYAIQEGKMDEFMDKILSDKELSEQVRYMKQFDFDPTEIPKGADSRFLNFYSQTGDFESVAKIDKLMSERYADLIVPGGAGSYRKGADFDLPSGLGTTRYDPNIKKLKAGQGESKFRRSLLGKKIGGSVPIDHAAINSDIDQLTYTIGTGLNQSDLEEVLLANPELFSNYLPANKRKTYYKARGGLIYASKGTLVPYQPRGTDTVPAMLTPGEFVVNRKSAKQNMGLLKAINNGHNVKPMGFNKGGIVPTKYYETGGSVSAGSSGGGGVSSISVDASSLDAAFSNFNSYVSSLSSVIDGFTQGTTELAGLSQAIGSLGNLGLKEGASLMANAGISVKEATTAFSSAMTQFNTAASSLSTAISTIPKSIALTVSGSIPVTVSVTIEGGGGGAIDTAQLEQSIMDKVALAINSATQGGISVDTAIA